MLTDIEIAQQTEMRPIAEIAASLGIGEEELEPYGRYKAKLNDSLYNRLKDQKIYIQVTYLLASEDTIAREFGVYDTIHDHFPKYVVSMDELDLSRRGIKHKNIRDFLLAKMWE